MLNPKYNFLNLSFCFLMLFGTAFAQNTRVEEDDTIIVCSYTPNKINEKAICSVLGFRTRPEAQRAVERIVSRSGLKQNFYVMECANIDNCFAATRNGERLIVYDASFMRRVNNITNTDWGALSILAHEIGHHLQGHTLKPGSDPNRELEADEFSGFVMYQMGASLKEAQSAIWKLTTDHDSGSHPPRRKRMAIIKKGYNNAKALYPNINSDEEAIVAKQTNTTPVRAQPKRVEEPVAKASVRKPILESKNKTPERVGCIQGNCSDGFGVAVNRKTREKYAGNWKKGRRSGYGIEFYASGRKKYEGDFSGSTFHGYGTRFYKNGSKYVGKFRKGVKNDEKATYYYRNGDRLFVRYVNGKKEGKAKIIYYNGRESTKYFVNDVEKR